MSDGCSLVFEDRANSGLHFHSPRWLDRPSRALIVIPATSSSFPRRREPSKQMEIAAKSGMMSLNTSRLIEAGEG
jgi:hypothetical protein